MAEKSNYVAVNLDKRFLTKNDIKELDPDVLDLVFGYIRNIKSRIPDVILLICLSYYYFDDNEYFADAHFDYCTVNSGKEISIWQGSKNSSAFGNVLIPSRFGGVYTWIFKICDLRWRSMMCIGISSEYEDTDEEFYNSETSHNYCLTNQGRFLQSGEAVSRLSKGPGFNNISTVTMTLDLHQRTLKYKGASAWSKYGFENEGFDDIHCGSKIYYKMAISFDGVNSKINLISFSAK